VYPGTHGKEYDLYSLGRDNQEGGEGVDADFGNWEPPQKQQ
jgi:general secretion pathway protein G